MTTRDSLIKISFFLGLCLFLVVLSGSNNQLDSSSYSSSSSGTLGLYRLLSELNIPISRWERPLAELSSEKKSIPSLSLSDVQCSVAGGCRPNTGLWQQNQTMIISGPVQFRWSNDLENWIRDGNTLILGGLNFNFDKATLVQLGIASVRPSNKAWSLLFDPFNTEPLSFRCKAPDVELCSGEFWQISAMSYALELKSKTWAVLAGSQQEAFIVWKRLGSGQVFIFAGDEFLRNDEIDRFDNLSLVLQLLSETSGVIYDEFHHGYVAFQSDTQKGAFQNLLTLTLYLLFLLVLFALSRSRRLYIPPQQNSPSKAKALDSIIAEGMTYHRRNCHALIDLKTETGEFSIKE